MTPEEVLIAQQADERRFQRIDAEIVIMETKLSPLHDGHWTHEARRRKHAASMAAAWKALAKRYREKRVPRGTKRVVYMAHPVRGDVPSNLAKAKKWIRLLETQFPNVAIVATWITECEVWDDSNEEERRAGIERDLAVLARCDEVWLVGGKVTAGMAEERDAAKALGIPVVDMTSICVAWWGD